MEREKGIEERRVGGKRDDTRAKGEERGKN